MRDFMKKRRLDPSRWSLITTRNASEILDLANTLGFKYKKLENGEFNHSFMITALDPAGRIGATQLGSGKDPQPLLDVLSLAKPKP
jgi:protein SCO1/2